ncbi:MAG: hypothetical protein ABSD99_07920 [Candidatus Bathyarchaeia archaeon]
MRVLVDKNVVRRWFESVLRANLCQPLTKEQELVVSILATARSQGVEINVTLETYNILTRILRNPQVAKAIIANSDTLYRSKPFRGWLRNLREATTLTGEDAKVLAYATFGTNLPGTFVGCEKMVTLDKGLANEFELKKENLEARLHRLKKRLPAPYQEARLPQVVLLETGSPVNST